jgi:hypothetical protein
MQEIPRAILLPPPSLSTQRASARGSAALDRDLPEEVERNSARRTGSAASNFLTLIEASAEDSVELAGDFRGKQFRFRPYNRSGGAERSGIGAAFERPAPDEVARSEAADNAEVAAEVLDGFASGARGRNSAAFLASFIAQERLSQGLYNPLYAEASDAYRRAGGSPAVYDEQPRVVSFAA